MSIVWRDDLAIGVQVIDDQHRELFLRISAILDAVRIEHTPEQIAGLFDFLDSYTRDHFTYEEEIQHRAGYPRLEEHKKMHAGFITTLAELKSRFAADGDSAALREQVNQFVVDWLLKHISIEDADLAQFLKS